MRNTNNTDRNSVNKQNTHTKHLEKDNTGNGGYKYEPGCFWNLFLDSAREASNDFNIFLNFRFIKKQKTAVFFEKILHANELKVKVSLNVPSIL